MTEDQIQRCKQSLLKLDQEHQEIELELKKAFAQSGDTVTLDQNSVGRLSRIDAMQGQQMALEASRRREMHAEKIEGGLRRIESGYYGYCFYYEEEIDYRRLETDPTNTCCLKCAG